jgi:hypothetical protein
MMLVAGGQTHGADVRHEVLQLGVANVPAIGVRSTGRLAAEGAPRVLLLNDGLIRSTLTWCRADAGETNSRSPGSVGRLR